MHLFIDLKGLKTDEEVLHLFGETFEFGGPDGNVPVIAGEERGWGMNWNALEDSLYSIGDGGIWGTSTKWTFPLEIKNYHAFEENNPQGMELLRDILAKKVAEHVLYGEANAFKVIYS